MTPQELEAAYHSEGKSLVTDEEYDAMPGTDTRIGAEPRSNYPRVMHTVEFVALKKFHTASQILRFYEGEPFIATPKIDGINLTLYYSGGKLKHALTRGNGIIGEDLLANVDFLPQHGPDGYIRGEVYINLDADLPTHPRNAAYGYVYGKDTSNRHKLQFKVFESNRSTDGFDAVPRIDINPLHETWFDALCAIEYEYPCDGVVLQGLHSGRKCCLKFIRCGVATTILDVYLQKSHHGTLTPVAELDPVCIDKVTIRRVTLNNFSWIETRNIAIGDTVRIVRANDVIPKLESVLQRPAHRKPITAPTCCPYCHATLECSGVKLRCPNPQCGNHTAFHHYAKTIGVKGVGPVFFDELVTRYRLRTLADLYSVVPQMGKQGATFLAELHRTKRMTKATFVQALGIPGVGKANAHRTEIPTDEETQRLLAHVVIVEPETPKRGKVCFTGTMSLPRAKLAALAIAHGYIPVDTVSAGTLLVSARDDTQKALAAKRMNCKVITETQFMEKLSESL